jgi:tetratricopeptide (TPR) repeat protein
MRCGLFNDAIVELTKAIELNTDDSARLVNDYQNRAVCYSNLQKPELALLDYKKSEELQAKELGERKE